MKTSIVGLAGQANVRVMTSDDEPGKVVVQFTAQFNLGALAAAIAAGATEISLDAPLVPAAAREMAVGLYRAADDVELAAAPIPPRTS